MEPIQGKNDIPILLKAAAIKVGGHMRHDQFIGSCITRNNAIIISGIKGEGHVVPAVKTGSGNNGYPPHAQCRSVNPGMGIEGGQFGIGDVGALGFRHFFKSRHKLSFLCQQAFANIKAC
jgi:hypothetical protein